MENFSVVNVIYLPGGNPFIFLDEFSRRGFDGFIGDFNGIIIGNSAGALFYLNILLVIGILIGFVVV
ncbi:MAG: hypothetical protein NDF55_06125 [archaeon GB-1867-005]|nr:hypothetical protein [Candidatus Culexmicrobium cathedralense]